MSQQLCLKWNSHTTNMLQVFKNLLSTETLVDVTLACEGRSLKAHKMMLSASSPFFQSLFLENPCKHPIVIMKDIRYSDLKTIIDFMYLGEVSASHDELEALLKTAKTLQVKGFAETIKEKRHAEGIVENKNIDPSVAKPRSPTTPRANMPPLVKRKRRRPRRKPRSDDSSNDDEDMGAKIKKQGSPEVKELSGDVSMEFASGMCAGSLPNSFNSQSGVPSHSSNDASNFSKSHLPISQDPQVDDQASGDEFKVEPSKLLKQTPITDNVPSNSQNSTEHINLPSVNCLEISRRSMSSTDSISQAVDPASDSLGSNLQGPDSPKDMKPQILSFDNPPNSPIAGTSYGPKSDTDRSGGASIHGKDNRNLVPHDSPYQDSKEKTDHHEGPETIEWSEEEDSIEKILYEKFLNERYPPMFSRAGHLPTPGGDNRDLVPHASTSRDSKEKTDHPEGLETIEWSEEEDSIEKILYEKFLNERYPPLFSRAEHLPTPEPPPAIAMPIARASEANEAVNPDEDPAGKAADPQDEVSTSEVEDNVVNLDEAVPSEPESENDETANE